MRLLLLLLTILLLLVTPTQVVHAKKQSSIYGQRLLSSTTLPADVLQRFEVFNQSSTLPDSTTTEATTGTIPSTSDWLGEKLVVSFKEQPYTIVVKTYGTAVTDGTVKLHWQLGWANDDYKYPQIKPANITQGYAGKPVEIVTHSNPTSFKADKPFVYPFVGFVQAENLKINRVEVQIWSGVPEANRMEILFAFIPLLIGGVMLVYWFKFR